MRPGIGGLLVWLRSCRLHAEQNFVKLLAGHMVLLCAKWDAAEGALETIAAGLANSRCEAMLKEFGAPFQLRRVCKRLLQTLEENGRSTTFGLFTWRFKSQDPQVYLNIFQNIWDSAFNFTKDTDTDFVFACACTPHIVYSTPADKGAQYEDVKKILHKSGHENCAHHWK